MATIEGTDKDTKLLADQQRNVPNFDVPYPIEEDMNITKITMFKRHCCNKVTILLILFIFLTVIYLAMGVFFAAELGFDGVGLIMLLLFGLLAIMLILYILKLMSILCQYSRTELLLNKQENIIQIYEAKVDNIYGNLNNINCSGCFECDLKPKITTICKLSDIIDCQLDNKEIKNSNCCSSNSIPLNQVKLTFTDMYSGNQNQYFIKQSGKYAEFTACQYLNYIIQENKNEVTI